MATSDGNRGQGRDTAVDRQPPIGSSLILRPGRSGTRALALRDCSKWSALSNNVLLAAAITVASASGLKVDEAVVIHSASNVLVHLRPAPVVARVMTGTVALHDDPRTWLEREISVLEFLAPSGVAVSPSRLIAPGPHCQDGLWMTFTEWIPEVEPGPAVQPAARLDDAATLAER